MSAKPWRKTGRTSSLSNRAGVFWVLLLLLLAGGCQGPIPKRGATPGNSSSTRADERLFVMGPKGVAEVDLDKWTLGTPVPTKGAAAMVVPNADRSRFYMATGRRELIEVYDVKQAKITDTLTLSKPTGLPVIRALIFGLVPSPDEKTLWVYVMPSIREREYLKMGDPYVAEVDLKTGKKLREVAAPPGVTFMLFLKDGHTLYLFGRDIYSVDTSAPTLECRTEVAVRHPDVQGEGETDIVAEWPHFRESGNFLCLPYAAVDPPTQQWFSGIMTIDLRTGEVEKLEVGPPPDKMVAFSSIMAPDGKRAYMLFAQMLTVDVEKRRQVAFTTLPRVYSVVTIRADGKRIYAGGSGSSVMEYDTENQKVLRELDAPYEITELSLSPR